MQFLFISFAEDVYTEMKFGIQIHHKNIQVKFVFGYDLVIFTEFCTLEFGKFKLVAISVHFLVTLVTCQSDQTLLLVYGTQVTVKAFWISCSQPPDVINFSHKKYIYLILHKVSIAAILDLLKTVNSAWISAWNSLVKLYIERSTSKLTTNSTQTAYYNCL